MVSPHADREDVARLIAKYNLLAVPLAARMRVIAGSARGVGSGLDELCTRATGSAKAARLILAGGRKRIAGLRRQNRDSPGARYWAQTDSFNSIP